MGISVRSAIAFIVLFSNACAQQEPNLTGLYEGVVACERNEDGRPGVFHKNWSLRLLHVDDRLDVATWTAQDIAAGRHKSSLYTGSVRTVDGRVSGYLETCRPAIPVRETVRILPAMETDGALSFIAETIFMTEALPGREGRLIVESCRWVMDRVSDERPVMETCEPD